MLITGHTEKTHLWLTRRTCTVEPLAQTRKSHILDVHAVAEWD